MRLHHCYMPAWPRFRQLLATLLLSALIGAACGTTLPTQEPVRITLAASSSALPLAGDIARAYHAANSHITVDVLGRANDAAAAESVLAGQADLALVTGAAPAGDGLSSRLVATDALAVVVHPDRPLENLTAEQMQEILRGLLRTWDEIGAGAGDIQVLTREQGAGPRQAMADAFLGNRPLTPTALVLPDDQQVLAHVAADSQAIAALPAAWLDERVRALSIDGRSPDWVMRQWPGYPAVSADNG